MKQRPRIYYSESRRALSREALPQLMRIAPAVGFDLWGSIVSLEPATS
jgi:hypothetical protein